MFLPCKTKKKPKESPWQDKEILLEDRIINLFINEYYDTALGLTLLKCKRSPKKLAVRVGNIINKLNTHDNSGKLGRLFTSKFAKLSF